MSPKSAPPSRPDPDKLPAQVQAEEDRQKRGMLKYSSAAPPESARPTPCSKPPTRALRPRRWRKTCNSFHDARGGFMAAENRLGGGTMITLALPVQ
jgi:hypothetical protein